MAYSSTIHDHGKKIALSGDQATCGNCKGAWKIYGTGTKMSDKGRAAVLDGDRVLCPCGKNRVIVGSNPSVWVTDNGAGGVNSATTASTASNSSQAIEEAKHTRWCFVWDRVTGEPLANRDFVADIGGVRRSGKTDGQGYAKIETDGEQPFDIHVIFSSPKRVLKPRQGN